jgi:hypothetical protein
MKKINILSWGGGTQSTALMLLMLEGKVKDKEGNVLKPDYIIFADTKNEASFLYNQLYTVISYIKKTYNFDIIVTSKNKEEKGDEEIIKMIDSGLKYRSSQYADLYQEHIMFFKGKVKSINVMPFWVRDEFGKVGRTQSKNCTIEYKVNQLLKELRLQEDIKRFSKLKYKVNMYLGFSVDEISRVKPSPASYVENFFPLVDMEISKDACINYVEEKLGFRPQSSVCNMCFANRFERVYKVYKEDERGWEKLIKLDNAMNDKPKNHALKQDVYMFKWQADLGVRLKDFDMEEEYKRRNKYNQLSIFDVLEDEEELACMGGCFL